MNRPKKVRAIFNEIQPSLKDDFTSEEILKFAADFLKTTEYEDPGARIRLVSSRTGFDELDVDQAIADGGWKVMAREKQMMSDLYSEEHSFETYEINFNEVGLDIAA